MPGRAPASSRSCRIMWGCLLAAAITFPLVWGWIHFETVSGDLHVPHVPVRHPDAGLSGGVAFTYPDEHEPCLLVRLTTSESVAFSQKCTHLSCAVIPRPAENSFYCPCDEGRFDLRTGTPTAGPLRRPLTRIVLDVRGRDIYAVGVEERTI